MVDTLQTKKVTDLTENTAMSDEDLFMVGSAGTASLRRLKWSNIWNTIKTAILGKLVSNNLTTTEEGYLLDARQGKALDEKISKLNTDLTPFFSDYNKKIADVTEASYTATENCLVICDLITTGAAYESMSISVNNLKIYIYQNIASQANIQSRTSYLLKAGDVIKISALTYAMYVYGRS